MSEIRFMFNFIGTSMLISSSDSYSLDDVKPKKRTAYKKSELRLLESLENVCDRILQYNIHKERKDSTRFAKGMSQTFQTLHGLVDKGVKVELGIPYELWGESKILSLSDHRMKIISVFHFVLYSRQSIG